MLPELRQLLSLSEILVRYLKSVLFAEKTNVIKLTRMKKTIQMIRKMIVFLSYTDLNRCFFKNLYCCSTYILIYIYISNKINRFLAYFSIKINLHNKFFHINDTHTYTTS